MISLKDFTSAIPGYYLVDGNGRYYRIIEVMSYGEDPNLMVMTPEEQPMKLIFSLILEQIVDCSYNLMTNFLHSNARVAQTKPFY